MARDSVSGQVQPVPGNALAKVRSCYSSLAKAERKVADYVLEHTDEVIFQSVTETASRAGVAESTVMRFCQTVGFRGFQEFKLMASRDLFSPQDYAPTGDVAPSDDLPTVMQKVYYRSKQALDDTMSVLDPGALEQAVDLVAQARKVALFGVGSSSITAWDARYRFFRIGVQAEAFHDSHWQSMSTATLTEKDVAIGFSHTGSTKDVVDCLRRAAQAGARVISITDHPRSPITQVSHVVLLTSSREGPLGSGSLRSRMAQSLVLELLFTGVMLRKYEQSVEITQRTAEAVLDKLY
ncbi:MAG TPA: MurR/RpiR family transcriptional regulator [Symbiobacteriaceae bacterium]|nr:MurR/RpiR family transcriptional regulator [Symbiobacteriaceae bacterium]